MSETGNLFAQQQANRKATRRLVAGFILFVAWLGFGGDFIWYLWSSQQASARASEGLGYYGVHLFPGLGIAMLLIAGVMAWWGYNFGATSLIKATGGHEILDPSSEAEQKLVNVVDEMSIASGTKRPHLWVIPDEAPNAFATGVHIDDAHIAVTQGLLDTLSRDELQAVVGHEMGHVANLDVRLMTLLTALVGVVALIHNSAFRVMNFGGGGRSRSRSRDNKGAGLLVVVLLVVWIISWLIAPIVTRLIAMKVGRSREYLADAMSAQYTRNPGALVDALEKISSSNVAPKMIPKSSAQLCIVDPFHSEWGDREGKMADLMATHPPLRERIARLRAMAYLPRSTAATA
ncbi:MAG: M48 family metallopeptidase [Gemmatimonadaceae bacterium]